MPKQPKTLDEALKLLLSQDDINERIENLELQLESCEDELKLFFDQILEIFHQYFSYDKQSYIFFSSHVCASLFQRSFGCLCYNFAETAFLKQVKNTPLYGMCLRFDTIKHYNIYFKYKPPKDLNPYNPNDKESFIKGMVGDFNYTKDKIYENFKSKKIDSQKFEKLQEILNQESSKGDAFPATSDINRKRWFYQGKINGMVGFLKEIKKKYKKIIL